MEERFEKGEEKKAFSLFAPITVTVRIRKTSQEENLTNAKNGVTRTIKKEKKREEKERVKETKNDLNNRSIVSMIDDQSRLSLSSIKSFMILKSASIKS